MFNKKFLSITILVYICINLCACQQQTEPIRQTALAIGTIVDITVFDKKNEAVLDEAMQKISYYDKIFNSHIQDSEVSKFNNSLANTDFEMSADLEFVISKALQYAQISNGKFDLSIYPASHLWEFSSAKPHVPNQKLLNQQLQFVDYHNIKYNQSSSSISKTYDECAIDLGGIAKGYIADQIVNYLKQEGVKKAIINLGGNVYALGEKSKNKAWKIGIQKPFDNIGSVLGTVKIKNQAVVTSGVYERQFIENDKAYHHILDPKTGYPYNNELSGVSIISTSATEADALSTVTYMMGFEESLEYIESLPNTEAIFITRNKEIILTSGMVDNFKCLDDSFSVVISPK